MMSAVVTVVEDDEEESLGTSLSIAETVAVVVVADSAE